MGEGISTNVLDLGGLDQRHHNARLTCRLTTSDPAHAHVLANITDVSTIITMFREFSECSVLFSSLVCVFYFLSPENGPCVSVDIVCIWFDCTLYFSELFCLLFVCSLLFSFERFPCVNGDCSFVIAANCIFVYFALLLCFCLFFSEVIKINLLLIFHTYHLVWTRRKKSIYQISLSAISNFLKLIIKLL